MGSRERQMHRRSKTHAAPVIIGSLFGFLLIAGIAFGVGMMGNINRWLSDLPDYTDANQYLVSEPTTVLDANGTEIASFYVENRESVTIDQVSPYVLKGTVATEDERFYEHNGVDLIGIARAVVVQLTGGSEGASTITQQLVRNTILSEEQFDNTIERKVREAFIAIKMEEVYSKDEILMMYLNTIYYGHGAYGIQTASKTYFSKNASDLTLPEAALLIGLPNAPSVYDPTVNPDYALSRRNTVLNRMASNGVITQEEADAAKAEPITLNLGPAMPESGTLAHPYFVDYVRSLLREEFTSDMIFRGGLTVKTTIDPDLQAKAEAAAVERMNAVGADELQVGVVVLDPKTGYIKAMVGGKDYNADENHVNHALSRRSTGSSFKSFTLAAAIKAGMNPSVMLNCASPLEVWGSTFQNYGNHNYGVRTLASATAVSSNTGYVQVAEAIGNKKIIDMCSKLGIDTKDEVANFQDVPSLTLGTASITPLEMAEAYTAFANGGYHREAVAITEIVSRDGKTLYKHEDNPEQVLTAGEAAAITNVLRGVMNGGTGSAGMPSINQPVAGKTGTAGTASDTTDLWFCGYTPQLVCTIWTGRSGGNYPINGYSTNSIPLPIFRAFMNSALSGVEREDFPTGTAPQYKANSSWKFSGGTEEELKKLEEEKKKQEEEEQKRKEEEEAQQNAQTPTTPTPTPDPETPTPDPEPEQPDPEPEPEPTPTPTPDPGA